MPEQTVIVWDLETVPDLAAVASMLGMEGNIKNRRAKEMTKSAVEESRIRRKARRLGYRVHKSRKRVPSADNLGRYMLFDKRGFCRLGSRYDATLDDIEAFLNA